MIDQDNKKLMSELLTKMENKLELQYNKNIEVYTKLKQEFKSSFEYLDTIDNISVIEPDKFKQIENEINYTQIINKLREKYDENISVSEIVEQVFPETKLKAKFIEDLDEISYENYVNDISMLFEISKIRASDDKNKEEKIKEMYKYMQVQSGIENELKKMLVI